jgi:hypothetical protein
MPTCVNKTYNDHWLVYKFEQNARNSKMYNLHTILVKFTERGCEWYFKIAGVEGLSYLSARRDGLLDLLDDAY